MELSKDALEFIRLLNQKKVKYLVVGGWAVSVHARPRYTKDIDIFIGRDSENAENIVLLLRDFGFESLDLSKKDFVEPNQIIQLGVEPNRIDLLTGLSGIDFEGAYSRRIVIELDGEPLNFICSEDLIANKLATGRDQDLVDVKSIREHEKKI